MFGLQPPRHTPTLPKLSRSRRGLRTAGVGQLRPNVAPGATGSKAGKAVTRSLSLVNDRLWHSATFGDGRGPRRMTTPNPLHRLVFCHCDHGAGERAVGLSQLIQNREVIGVGDRYQVAGDMPLRSVGMVIAAARDHRRQLAG